MKKLIISLFGLALIGFAGQASAASVQISGNGSDSYNRAKIRMSQYKTVSQSDYTKNSTTIVMDVNTGGNDVEGNTGNGSDNKVETGNVATDVIVSNVGGSNVIEDIDDCGCEPEEVDITIKNNGTDSTNKAEYSSSKKTRLSQRSKTHNYNSLGLFLNTGDNEVEDNTGKNGDNSLMTGRVRTSVLIENLGLGNLL